MMRISEVACFSFSALEKASNEDYILPPLKKQENGIFLAIADGVGSLQGSGSASENAIMSINESINKELTSLDDIFKNAYIAVSELDKKVATTLTIIKVNENKIEIGHIGDCRAYVLVDDKLIQLTKDHNKYQGLIDSGQFNAYQLRKHKERLSSILTSAIAKEHSLDYEKLVFSTKEYVNRNELTIYLMSDGAYYHWDKRRKFSSKTMNSPSSFSASLRKRIEKDIQDDYSLIGVKIEFSEI